MKTRVLRQPDTGGLLVRGCALSIFAALFLGGIFQVPKLHFFLLFKGAEALRVPGLSLVLGVAIICHCDHEADPSRRNDRVAVLGWEGARLPHAALAPLGPAPAVFTWSGCLAHLAPARGSLSRCGAEGLDPAGPGPSRLDSVNPSWTWSIPAGPGRSRLVPEALPWQGCAPHRSSGQEEEAGSGEGRGHDGVLFVSDAILNWQ